MKLKIRKVEGRWLAVISDDQDRAVWADHFKRWGTAVEIGVDVLGTWART